MVTIPRPLPAPPPIPMPRYSRPGGYGDWKGAEPTFWDRFQSFAGSPQGMNLSDNLLAIGTGLLSGKNFSDGMAIAGQHMMQQRPYQRQRAQQYDDQAKAETMRERYARLILNMGPDDPSFRQLADAVSVGGIEPAEAWNTSLKYQADSKTRAEELRRNKSNAAFLTDPQLRAAVESGSMDFKTAWDMQQGNTPKLTDDMIEFNAAVSGGYEGGLDDWLGKGQGTDPISANVFNGVDYGDPGSGLQWLREGGQMQFDPNGAPIAVPLTVQTPPTPPTGTENLKASTVVEDIDRALITIGSDWTGTSTGFGSQLTGWIGGTPAHNVQKLISSVRANIGFDELQRMRDASPTGGALGQVAVQELNYLQSVLGDLEQSQSAPQLIDNLIRVQNAYLDVVHGEGNGPPRKMTSMEYQRLPQVSTEAEYAKLPAGAKYRDPDGKIRTKA